MDEESALYVLQKVMPHFVSIATEEAKTLPDEDGGYRKERKGMDREGGGGREEGEERSICIPKHLCILPLLPHFSFLLPPPPI